MHLRTFVPARIALLKGGTRNKINIVVPLRQLQTSTRPAELRPDLSTDRDSSGSSMSLGAPDQDRGISGPASFSLSSQSRAAALVEVRAAHALGVG